MIQDVTYKIGEPIAVIGMGCIFPEARNLKAYWHLLFNGVDAIKPIPEDSHWQLQEYYDADPARPDHTYCTQGGFIPPVAFDPLSYGIPPNNIEATDTSQLLGLEVASMALADAGYPAGHRVLQEKKVNVILGVTGTQELVIPLGARLGHPLWKKAMEEAGLGTDKTKEVLHRLDDAYVKWQENSFPGLLGNVVAGRIANRLNLSGTNAVSDAACASSLSAVHTAILELEAGRCDMAITGGVDTLNDIFMHMCFSKTGVLSHTSDAKPFSKEADGTVLGEGIGMLVLKRLSDAEQDKDRIYAVIKGMGTSSDGKTSAIYAPEAKGQLKALKEAYGRSGVDPSTVDLVEAHGTGTRVGDKVEFTALKACYDTPGRVGTTAIGSVKSMIGHTKAAAGAAGMIKAVLALHNKVIPPTLKAATPDPELKIQDSAFYLNARSKPWAPRHGKDVPRRSGVSAFGFGGSNFHAVLEEYASEKSHVSWDGSVQILALSATDRQALASRLEGVTEQLNSFDAKDPGEFSQAVAWQAFESRRHFSSGDEYRLLVLISNDLASVPDRLFELLAQAMDAVSGKTSSKAPVFFGQGRPKGKLGFVYPGQGSQYTGMARDILSTFPEAMEALDSANTAFDAQASGSGQLSDYIYPLPEYARDKKASEEMLRQTQVAQPAIGALSIAMTKVLKRFGLEPDMTCGHSFGELSALYSAGWIDQDSLFRLSAARGCHMAEAGQKGGETGSMLAVQAPVEKIQALIETEELDLVLANKNSYRQGVLSGTAKEIDRAVKLCRKQKMRAVKLPVAAAFHSRLVKDAARPFCDSVAEETIAPTRIDVLSNTTGKVYPGSEEEIKALLGNQLMHPVNFIDNIETMYDNGVSTFVEVGPKTVLTGLIRSILDDREILACAVDGSGGKKSGLYDLGESLCTIAAQGFPVDLTPWEDPAQKPVPKKMKVMLTGANPKPASAKVPAARTKPAQAVKTEAISPEPEPSQHNVKTDSQNQSDLSGRQKFDEKGGNMTPSPEYSRVTPIEINTPAASPQGNVHLIQKGLEAMQQLQEQTARAHEKFLETQAQASQTLADIMAQTRGVALPSQVQTQPAVPATVTPQNTPPARKEPEQTPRKTAATPSRPAEPVPAEPMFLNAVPQAAPEASPVPDRPSPETSGASVQAVLFKVVSRLTGFPVEMLEPEMDIESDLGIDSIKKVEIISEIEKEIPSSQGMSTDHLTSARTLGDICGIMTSGSDPIPLSTDSGTPASEGKKAASGSGEASESVAPASGTPDNSDMFGILAGIISELTGFPAEMLEPEMDLESDLGIDSIKRVEILSKLEQERPDAKMLSPDDLATLKTIQDIANVLSPAPQQTVSEETGKKKTSHDRVSTSAGTPDEPEAPARLLRQEVVLKKYPTNQIRFYNGSRISISPDKTIYLTRDSAGIAQALKAEFRRQGCQASLIDISSGIIPELPHAAGVVIISDAAAAPDDNAAKSFLFSAFALAAKAAPHLMDAAREQGAFFTTVTFSGGGFGFERLNSETSPVYGGLAGLAKTADIEWKNVLCRALDMPGDPDLVKARVEDAAALMMTQGAVEMGLDGDQCIIPALEAKDMDRGEIRLGKSDVVVITGGAKGVTAECALHLAKACSPKIALLGRSPEPFPEPEWIDGITDPGEMKKAILAHGFKGRKARPADVQERYKEIVSNRSVRDNIARIRDHASDLKYISVDIRDKAQMTQVFAGIGKDMGPVSALIHGAGVLEDKLITDKKPEQFNRVFDTKVDGLESLLAAGISESLTYLVLFSSVAARHGNQGQCDYAMANEVLNKVAQTHAKANPDCRCLSVNWGPWAGGMVDDGLKKEFSKRGIGLIPLAAGAEQLLVEMGNPDKDCVEVVIGASLNPQPPKKKKRLTTALTRELGPKASPVINHHKINHEPVVPFAMMADLIAHAAEKNTPGLKFAGLDEMRLLKGMIPRNKDVNIQVDTGECESGYAMQNASVCSAALASQADSGRQTVHATAQVLLQPGLPEPPVLSKAAFMDLKPYGMSVRNAYEKVLFHDKGLQCITSVNGVSSKGIEVIADLAPGTDQWYAAPHNDRWTIDPMMLDAAFQAAILWTYETRQQVCLPGFFSNLRVYSSYEHHTGPVRILFTVNHQARNKIQGYFTFLNDADVPIASIMGFEAVIDPGLMEKFHPAPLFDREKILAFAQGNPSDAFGEPYRVFDKEREIARLPRPPYFFMDRVVKADHTPWDMQPGGWIETDYHIPDNAWYFSANRTLTMPFCILLEIALQPCGWLAAYAGSALKSDERLHFRNLGGKATLVKNVTGNSGNLTVRARMTDVSQAGGMIIQNFDMAVLNLGEPVYQGTTNFGFFTAEALSNQVGIRNSRFRQDVKAASEPGVVFFEDDAPVTPEDNNESPDSGMPAKAIRMIDAIDLMAFDGGVYQNGLIKATKKVVPDEWFFDAHFYQDPVCPGSLGVESFLQLLRYFLVKKYDINIQDYAPIMTEGQAHEWTYRGQIIPTNKTVDVHAHVKQHTSNGGRYSIVADGALTVDGICIYEMKDFGLSFVPAGSTPS